MKKILILVIFTFFIQNSFGQKIIQYKISKPYCIFNFLETANKGWRTSKNFQEFIVQKTKGDENFLKLCNDFQNIEIDYAYTREEFPKYRRQNRSTYDLLVITLVNSNTLEEFKDRGIGILPLIDHLKLFEILKQVEENYYNRLVWDENKVKINNQISALDNYSTKSELFFKTLNHFYNSNWRNDVPFIVTLYPIPGDKGGISATPHANSLCVGSLTDSKDYEKKLSVVLHEIGHVLFDEQSKEFQQDLDKFFNDNKSPYKKYAYSFLDEGLATALGNGYVYKELNGTLDNSSWYNNDYIDGYAKALLPMVEDYINKKQKIDRLFVEKAIDLFAEKFPKSIYDYNILLSNVTIYADTDNSSEIDDLIGNIRKNFRLININVLSDILDKTTSEQLRTDDKTQLIIIEKDNKKKIKELCKSYPQIKKTKVNLNSILSFYDNSNRPIIIINADSKNKVFELLKKMKDLKYFENTNILQN